MHLHPYQENYQKFDYIGFTKFPHFKGVKVSGLSAAQLFLGHLCAFASLVHALVRLTEGLELILGIEFAFAVLLLSLNMRTKEVSGSKRKQAVSKPGRQ